MSELARLAGKLHPPLFAPLLHSVAAEIEAIAPQELVRESSRLRKNLIELRRIVGTDTIACAVPSAMEAEALGAQVSADAWPPRVTAGIDRAVLEVEDPGALLSANLRVSASVDAARQIAAVAGDAPVLVAALTGPATLVGQLCMGTESSPGARAFEFAGRLLASLIRAYAEAGVHVFLLVEEAPPPDNRDDWVGALSTACNVARFHRAPPLLALHGGAPAEGWPRPVIACPARPHSAELASRPHGILFPADPAGWVSLPDGSDNARIVITAGEPPSTVGIAQLREHVARVLSSPSSP